MFLNRLHNSSKTLHIEKKFGQNSIFIELLLYHIHETKWKINSIILNEQK